jgi:membrane associated rhomboid family serine protease
MNSFFEQIQITLKQSTALKRLMIFNTAVFLLISICRLILVLFRLNDAWLYLSIDKLSVPSDFLKLLTQPWSLISYMFVHVDFFHILFNMLVLFWTGSLFMEYLGQKKLVSTYFLGGLCGGIFYILAYNLFPAFQDLVKDSTLIGASAGVLAILTAIATLLPDYQVHLIFFGPVRLKYVAIFLIILCLINIPQGNAGGQFAHLGGAFFGFIYIRQLKKGRDLAAWFNKIADLFSSSSNGRTPRMKVSYKRSVSDEDYKSQLKSREEQVDRILDKISQSGYDSLSKEEKEILFNASKNKSN